MIGSLKKICQIFALAYCTVVQADKEPRFVDVHLHYSQDMQRQLPPDEIARILSHSQVDKAVIIGSPPQLAQKLKQSIPTKILPFLGVYQRYSDKMHWHQDMGVLARVRQQLKRHQWHGVGELHLFAEQRNSPVFLGVAKLATEKKLPLMLHCDPVVIDTVFAMVPDATVIWAHAGAYPYPPLLKDYLRRYPRLYIDLTVRETLIAPGGQIKTDWEELLIEYSDRFLVGVDTYSVKRWQSYAEVASTIRHWLVQLPKDVQEALSWRNAQRILGF